MNLYNILIIIKNNPEDIVNKLKIILKEKGFKDIKIERRKAYFQKDDINIKVFYCPTDKDVLSLMGDRSNVTLYEDSYSREVVEDIIKPMTIRHRIRQNVSHETFLEPLVGTLERYSSELYESLQNIY